MPNKLPILDDEDDGTVITIKGHRIDLGLLVKLIPIFAGLLKHNEPGVTNPNPTKLR